MLDISTHPSVRGGAVSQHKLLRLLSFSTPAPLLRLLSFSIPALEAASHPLAQHEVLRTENFGIFNSNAMMEGPSASPRGGCTTPCSSIILST